MAEPNEPSDAAQVASEVEHELANSLASIIGFSQLIRRDPSLPADLRRSADLLVEEAIRTRRIVEGLLDLLRHPATEGQPAEPHRAPDHHQPPVPHPTAAASPTAAPSATADASPTWAPSVTADASSTAAPSATAGASARGLAGDAHAPEDAVDGARSRVLVVDDDGTFRVFLERALIVLGYEPVLASLGADAVELARRGELAAIVCDHQMPGMSGIEVYDAMTADAPHLADRFVMMSGDVGAPAVTAFAAARPITLLAKPFDLDTLERTLRSVIGGSAQPRG